MRAAVGATVVAVLALAGCSRAEPVTAPPPGTATAALALDVGPAAAVSGSSSGSLPAGAAFGIGPGAVDTTGGSLPDGQTISAFDVANPVVGLLDPALLAAVQKATRAAAADGVGVRLTSGWRSKGFQKRLFADGVATYGSVDAASQFVASPEASMHVQGKAVDVGPTAADDWMIGNGVRFGLCQIYANEIWHFELAADAQGTCPPLRPNAAG